MNIRPPHSTAAGRLIIYMRAIIIYMLAIIIYMRAIVRGARLRFDLPSQTL